MADKTVDQIENDVRAALAADIYEQYDEIVTVVDYQAVVNVMLEDGTLHARRLYSGEQDARRILGDATWLTMAAERDVAEAFDTEEFGQ